MRPHAGLTALALAALAAALLPATPTLLAETAVSPPALVFADGEYVVGFPIQVPPGGRLVVRNATLHLDWRCSCDTPQVLAEGASIEIVGSRIDTTLSTPWRIVGKGSRIVAHSSSLSGYGDIVFELDGGRSLLANSTFADARGPVTFARGAPFEIRDSRFERVPAGVFARDASGAIVGSSFRGIPGRAIDVQSTLVGEKQWAAAVRIEGNDVRDGGSGILRLSGFPDEIVGNTLANLTTGVIVSVPYDAQFAHHDAPRSEGNSFSRDTYALAVNAIGAQPGVPFILVEAHGNSFDAAGGCIDVLAGTPTQTTLVVDATANWWGSAAGPIDRSESCPAVQGVALVDPWLLEPPAP